MMTYTPEEQRIYDRNTYRGPLPSPKPQSELKPHPLAGRTPGVRSTSRKALKSMQHELGDKQRQLYVALQMSEKPMSDRDLAMILKWEINSVNGRRNELMTMGKIREAYRKPHPATKKAVIYWDVVR